jgi:RNA recognition motif-containing protein
VLIIDDIPRANEADIFEGFPTVVSLTIERYTAYCKFNSHEDAKAVLENRYSHFIKEKRIFVEKGSEAQFNDLVKKYGKRDNPGLKTDGSATSENGDQNSSQSNEDKPISRDPRQRSNQNGDSYRNNLKTDCIIIKRMHRTATIEDVEQFLSDLNIQKNQIRIHILLDKRGQPSGDCFVEFQFENDVQKAVTKNNMYIGQNRVEVLPIPREQVNAVLNSFGPGGPPGNDDRNSQPGFGQNQRRDWGPPPDFGSPNCVVMVSNLSYRASIEEILEAFREFDVKPDQIIRRFNDNGQPTGMACINFNSPEDASRACDQFNKTLVANRPIWLRRA